MKRFYMTAYLLLVTVFCFAQITPKDSIKKDTIRSLATVASATNISVLIPQLTPKSPNVASLGRFGEYPVNGFVGLLPIEIPIFNIEVGGLSQPIKLKYHSGGIKVTDAASLVGLGWALEYNSSVNRQLRGVADESSIGLLGKIIPVDIQASQNAICYNEDVRFYYQRIAENTLDTERDLFSLSMPSKSNQFILRDTTNYQWISPEPTKIKYSRPNSSFTINDEGGNEYLFDNKEITTGVGASSWLISQAQGTRPQDKILWEYYPVGNYSRTHDIVESITVNDNGTGTVPSGVTMTTPGSNPTPNLISVSNSVEQKLPKTIHFPSGKIEFVLETADRQDGLGKALDKIDIYGYDIDSLKYRLIKTYDLIYVYRNRSDGSPVLFLNEVKMLDNAGTEIGKYQLGYNTAVALPALQSKAKDFWGYYNGKTTNTSLIPAQNVPVIFYPGGTSGTVAIGGGNRQADENYMKAWVLNKITYPTGGYTEFDYEANRYWDGSTLRQAGGLRVLNVRSTANSTSPVIPKSYRYGLNEDGAGTLRQSLALQYNTEQKVISCQSNTTGAPCSQIYSYRIRTYTSNLSGPLFPQEGSPVTYNTVTEYQDLNATGINGKTISEYREASDNIITLNRGAKFFLNSRHWNRGQLLRKRVFGQDNLLKYKVENTYQVMGAGSTSDFCGRMAQTQTVYEGSRNQYLVGSSLCYSDVDDYQPAQIYFFDFGTTKLVQSDEYVYDNQDDTKFTKKSHYTDYIPNYYFPRLSREIVNGGEVRGKKLFYPFDYQNIPATTTGELFSIRRLLEKNQINAPIEELSYYKSSFTATDSLISGAKLTSPFSKEDNSSGTYKSIFVATNKAYLLESQAFNAFGATPYKSSSELYNASPSSYTSDLPKHGLYDLKLTMTGYDFYGNLDGYTIANGRTDAFSYLGSFSHNGVRLYVLGGQTQDNGGLNHSTIFNYKLPILGLSSIKAPNGIFTYFNFDTFGRLKNILDHNSKVLKEYAYNYTNQSVTEWMPREELSSVNTSTSASNALKMISFVDGLGRDLQKIIVKGSPDSTKDIVASHVIYNAFGQPYKSYLTSPSSSVGGTLISLANLKTVANTFYGDTIPYNETTAFDNSPLNRAITNFGAGNPWRTANKSMGMQYSVAPAGTIKRFKASTGAVFCNVEGQPTTIDYYGANELQKKVSTSERGKTVTEYIDLQGRVVQKEVEVSADTILTICYCYDLYDRLAYCIPPNAYKLFTSTRAFMLDTESDSKEGLYVYKYDRKGQLIQKRVAGQTDFEIIVYDKLYRKVLSRDAQDDQVLDSFGRSRFKFQKFDAIDRPVMSGLTFLFQGFDRQTLQTDFDNHPANLTNESRVSSGGLFNYANTSFPVNYTPADMNVRLVNYFDNYTWQTDALFNFDATKAFGTRYTDSGATLGIATGSLERNVETLDWYRNVNYFDFKSRIIQAAVQNHVGGIDRLNLKYSFTGEILKALKTTDKGTTLSTITELSEYFYNHTGNKTHFFYTKDNLPKQLIATYQYDNINRLNRKSINPAFAVGSKQTGSWMSTNTWLTGNLPTISDFVTINTGHTVTIPAANTAQAGRLLDKGILNIQNTAILQMGRATASPTALQTIDFSYHIRNGALKGINLDASGNVSLAGGKLFSLKLGFEDSGFYDGNIGSQTWLSSIDNLSRTYTHRYDGASRIKAGVYSGGKTGENYTLGNVNYDNNGNITNLLRNGLRANNTFGIVDNLSYIYQSNSNKIQAVSDISGETASFTDAVGATDYTYLADGSLKSDANKGISLFEYNYLKLPKKVTYSDGKTISYQYSASGKKLKETTSTSDVTDYVGNVIYKNSAVYQVSHDEGRTVNNVFEYDIKDHLGSLRVSFKDSLGIAKVTQESHTGIFGEILPSLVYTNTPKTDNFDYTGHERLKTFNLGYIDAGARLYDPLVPRFTTLDPLAELSRRFSPTVYGNANPVRFIDPDGMKARGFVSASGYYSDDAGSGGEQDEVKVQEKEDEQRTDDKDKDKAKKVTNGDVPLEKLSPFAMAKLGKARPIKTSYTTDEIITVVSIASMFGIEFTGVGEVLFGFFGRLLGTEASLVTEQAATKGGTYITEKIAGFYIRGNTTIANGTYTRTIQALANEGGNSLFKLLRVFEAEARGAGVNKVVINGVDIVEKRLINEAGAKLLGYSFKQTSENSIQLIKILK